jgi:chromosome partitioning protein
MILVIANQKGGVGKTTTAINLASSLAVAEQRTLLVDFDPQGNATSGLGVDKRGLSPTVYDALIGRVPLADCVRPTALRYLSLVPATMDLIGAEVELVGAEEREARLRRLLEGVRDDYRFILIDCPPSLGLLTVNALSAADGAVIPLQAEYYALEGLSQLLNTIDLIRDHYNPRLAIRGILLTMFDSRINLSAQVAQEVRDHFPGLVFSTVIPRNVKLGEAPSFGKPVLLYDIRSRGAEAYLNLAKEILGGNQEGSR